MILLIRHGETALNAAKVVQPADTPLSEHGLAQAELLARRVVELGAARIVSSDLPRASTTAQAVARATGAPLELSPLLQERNFGELRGTPYAELSHDIFARSYQPPGGESWAQLEARTDQAFAMIRELATSTSGNLVVVSHGLLCLALVLRHTLLPQGVTPPTRFDNASLTTIEATQPYRVLALNDVAHLHGLQRAGGLV